MRMSRSWRVGLAVVASLAVTGTAAGATAPATAQAPTDRREDSPVFQGPWKLLYAENFSERLPVRRAEWVRDPHGDDSPWHVGHLDDDGRFFQVQGGEDFRRQLRSFDVMRKRVSFGTRDWLTAELAARDLDQDGDPESPPSLHRVKLGPGDHAGRIAEPSHDTGIIIRNTRPLPAKYRIEYTLRTLDFGGKRDGSWEYDGETNGYDLEGCKTNWPWIRRGDFSGPTDPCNENFGDVRAENGYYFLSIMDYANPAPHNNIFIHNHRKVGMDAYSVSKSWAGGWYKVCNPASGEIYPFPESNGNAINSIFFDGSRWNAPEIGYNEFIMPTECGVRDGADRNATIVSAAEIRPELMPEESYQFAIERTETGYAVEMTGNFRYIGEATLRYHRDFVEDGRPIWHYNQTPEEYDGRFNSTLTFSGPHGSYSVEQWPAGSAYPDFFILGDPHLNYYEGSATVDDIRLYVPAK